MISIKYQIQIQRIKCLLRSVRLMEKIFASLGNIFAFILPSGIFANFLWWVILVIFALEYFMKWYLLGGGGRNNRDKCRYVVKQVPQTIYETSYESKCHPTYENQCQTTYQTSKFLCFMMTFCLFRGRKLFCNKWSFYLSRKFHFSRSKASAAWRSSFTRVTKGKWVGNPWPCS